MKLFIIILLAFLSYNCMAQPSPPACGITNLTKCAIDVRVICVDSICGSFNYVGTFTINAGMSADIPASLFVCTTYPYEKYVVGILWHDCPTVKPQFVNFYVPLCPDKRCSENFPIEMPLCLSCNVESATQSAYYARDSMGTITVYPYVP